MNPYLKYAFELGQGKAYQDFGLTKEAGPVWEGVKQVGRKLLFPVGASMVGAGVGALAGGEGNRLRGALMGGLGGLGLYGGIRAARGLVRMTPETTARLAEKLISPDATRMLKHLGPEELRAVGEQFAQRAMKAQRLHRGVLGGILGLGGLGAGLYAGSAVPLPDNEKPGLFSLTPERVEGLKQLIPVASQLLPAMVRGRGAADILPDLSSATTQQSPFPGMSYGGQQQSIPMPYSEMTYGAQQQSMPMSYSGRQIGVRLALSDAGLTKYATVPDILVRAGAAVLRNRVRDRLREMLGFDAPAWHQAQQAVTRDALERAKDSWETIREYLVPEEAESEELAAGLLPAQPQESELPRGMLVPAEEEVPLL